MGALDGKAVVITGAGRGIGAAYARAAADEGAAVIVNDIDFDVADEVAESIREVDGVAIADGSDITSWEQAGALIQRCIDEFDVIDGLVNNAGLFTMGAPDEVTEKDWREILAVNVLGTAYCGCHAARHMVGRGTGAIVNVTSGSQVGLPVQGIYGASKGAVASLTYSWAIDLGPRGIRVNAVSPLAATRMADVVDAYQRKRRGDLSRGPAVTVRPEQNAPVVVFLLSDDAAGVNGQVVRIDGSRLSLMSHPAVMHPPITKTAWTPADVGAAFADRLFDQQFPLGLVGIECEVFDYRTDYSLPEGN